MLPGVLAGIEQGWFQQEIADAAWRQQVQVEKRRRLIIGVNEFVHHDEPELEILRISKEVEREQVRSLGERALHPGRSDASTRRLSALTDASRGTDNLIPLIIDAARASATEGEIIGAMREAFGEYREAPRF